MKTDIETVFKHELFFIKDEDLKSFVIKIANCLTPNYFWTAPASSSGKYHPEFALGKGGLVRHTKVAVWWAVELHRAWEYLPLASLDEIVGAVILHDMLKWGRSYSDKMHDSTSVHGEYLAQQIRLTFPDESKQYPVMVAAVESHMGVWTKTEIKRPDKRRPGVTRNTCHLVHMADYCASRKYPTETEIIVNQYKEEDV